MDLNLVLVTVRALAQEPRTFMVREGTSLGDFLRQNPLPIDNIERQRILVNGSEVSMYYPLRKRDVIVISPPIETLKEDERPSLRDEQVTEVFISYAIIDSERFHVPEIAVGLEAKPAVHKVHYWEGAGDYPGDIIDFMEKQVPSSEIFIPICTEASKNSPSCDKERKLADYRNKKVIPVFTNIEHVPELVKFKIGIDASNKNTSQIIEQLYTRIIALISDETTDEGLSKNKGSIAISRPNSIPQEKFDKYIQTIENIPETEAHLPLIRILELSLKSYSDQQPWQIYCYAKFVICYLLHLVFVQKNKGDDHNLLGLYHSFDGVEHDTEERFRFHIRDLFQEADFIQVYNRLNKIWGEILDLGRNNERFFNWTEFPLIREIMREDLISNPIYNSRHTEESITADELTKLLTLMTSYNYVIKHRFNDPEWLKLRNLEKASIQQKEESLARDIEEFRQKIPLAIAMEMFELALKFCDRYIEKYLTW